MNDIIKEIQESVDAIKRHSDTNPEVAIILGTGLGGLSKEITDKTTISYKKIPHFPLSTVESHEGELVIGNLEGKRVIAMAGRFHRYEGYSMKQITFPVRVIKALGVKILLVSNAAGGMNRNYEPGDLMIITDHIGLFLGDNPLIGPNEDKLGLRFPDMSEPYSRELIKTAYEIALKENIRAHKGIYVGVTGPNLETAAEYRFLSMMGADAVGMSTIPEVIVAVHSGLKVLGISVITDKCIADTLKPTCIEEVIETAKKAEIKLTKLMKLTVKEIKL